MDEACTIRYMVRRQGVSIREVARRLAVSRQTVKRYLRDDVVPGKRAESNRSKPLRDKVLPRVLEILKDAPRWTAGKQRLTGRRLHEMLLSEGVEIGLTTVCAMLKDHRRREREVFIPLEYPPGDLAEVDIFEVWVDLGGLRRKAWMFVMRLMHSGRDFAWIYDRQDQVSFLDGHVRAFEHFGGVPARIALDNLKAAVAKILAGSDRELAARYQALCAHYAFEPCFARPRTGHDKGGVESRGRSIRWSHLVPIPAGESWDSIGRPLLARLDARQTLLRSGEQKTIGELFEVERQHLLPVPTHAFASAKSRVVSVSPRALVLEGGAYYSVWSEWAGLDVDLEVHPSEVVIRHGGCAVTHPRLRVREKSIDYRHYVRELARKPQAIRQVSGALMRDLGKPFQQAWDLLVERNGRKQAARAFACVLDGIVRLGMEDARNRLQIALDEGQPLTMAFAREQPIANQASLPSRLVDLDIEAAKATDFDAFLEAVR